MKNKKNAAQMSFKKILALGGLALGIGIGAVILPQYAKTSDHDDGEVETKGRNLNLTDLYVFREKDQNSQASSGDLVFIMNTNPRSLARQQYYFSTRARYEFNVTRVANNNATPTGKPDVTLRFEFEEPNSNAQQKIKVTTLRDGSTSQVAMATTTPIINKPNPVVEQVSVGGTNLSVFAGLREDPFFFDVEQYFRVRAGALGIGPAVGGFRPPDEAIDFTRGYNVNAIAVRVPIKFLQGSTTATTFDVWQTISVAGANNKYNQVERLARPLINEGLIVTNNFLNALNSVGPDFEASALAGQQPAAGIAAPIIAEAKKTIKEIGNNSDERTDALLGAFLPDVMRIDTTNASGYGNAFNKKGSPIRGRLLKDDVVDITLGALTNGVIKSDNVSYDGTPGNPAQGHNPLVTSFPYLALPN